MIRDAVASDHAAILALNEASVRFLSPLNAAELQQLDQQSAYHRVVEISGEVVAFLLVLHENADYGSPNYRWFVDNFDRFLYIDRVVISVKHQGQRLGAALYDDLFVFAHNEGTNIITCEYDIEPPNEASKRFHDRFGFREVGSQWLSAKNKKVSLQACHLESARA